jgi:hypothetical protein
MYGFLYVTDREEGLVIVGNRDPKSKNIIGIGTLLDGNPSNNFLERAVTFNPDGILAGAKRITIAGTYAYILTPKNLVVVSLEDPFHPKVTATLGEADGLVDPRGVQIQFRYGFVVDTDGLKVLDVTSLDRPRVVKGTLVPFKDARNLYVARTYAFVAAGHDGLGIVDIEKPERPSLEQTYNDAGKINDTNDVKIGMTNASQFAYLADGHNGLQVVQLFSPSDNPNYLGFSPHPTPQRIAQYPMHEALAISEGIDRDRAVDESGNQLAVFGRRGARPFTKAEMEKLFMRGGEVYTVTNTPSGRPVQTADTGVAATLRRWWDVLLQW